jgi:hypothetical protein
MDKDGFEQILAQKHGERENLILNIAYRLAFFKIFIPVRYS